MRSLAVTCSHLRSKMTFFEIQKFTFCELNVTSGAAMIPSKLKNISGELANDPTGTGEPCCADDYLGEAGSMFLVQ